MMAGPRMAVVLSSSLKNAEFSAGAHIVHDSIFEYLLLAQRIIRCKLSKVLFFSEEA
jgi:hypothetical protein